MEGRHVNRLQIAGAVIALALQPSWLSGQDSDTLRLADAVATARRANPMLRAARLRADAAVERAPQAGALPDPQLALGLLNRPVGDFGSTDQMMTMNAIELSQRFPWPGKLGFSEDRAEHLYLAEQLEADESEATLVARVKAVYYQLAYMDRALKIMRDTRDLLRQFEEVSTALYAVGTGLQQDVLQAQVSVAAMTEDITVVEQNRIAMAARLNALLGRAATVPIGGLELPLPTGGIPSVDSLMAVAAQHRPALRAARERALAAEAGYRAAGRAVYPDFTLRLGYGQRPEFDDLATIAIGINIPLWAGSKQSAQRREMQAMQTMEEARELDLYNETFARIAEQRAEAERARKLGRLYTTSVLPQARAAVESALSAYRVGRVDFNTLVQNELTVNRYEIERVRLTADYHRATAQLDALIGEKERE